MGSIATATSGNTSLAFTYDGRGVRTSKTVNGIEHKYYYSGSKLLRETYGSNILDFAYNADGSLYSLRYNQTYYYYVTNLQGDVISLVDASGEEVASYEYDPYGDVLSVGGTQADTIGAANPMRYRGYYYDAETGFYYLQSRYYDPEIGRFINSDSFMATGPGMLGNNMFAYCGNNPVNRCNSTGTYYTPGQIHDFVVEDICKENPNKTGDDTYIRYYDPVFRGKKRYTYGFCDVYDMETHEVWEVKRLGGGLTCTPASAGAQLGNYVARGFLKYHDGWKLKFGGTETYIKPNIFTKEDNDGAGMYVIGYFDAGNGLVFYDYFYLPSTGETVAIGCAIVGLWALFSGAGFAGVGAAIAPIFA